MKIIFLLSISVVIFSLSAKAEPSKLQGGQSFGGYCYYGCVYDKENHRWEAAVTGVVWAEPSGDKFPFAYVTPYDPSQKEQKSMSCEDAFKLAYQWWSVPPGRISGICVEGSAGKCGNSWNYPSCGF